jgi:polar amino acid transport system substrate-binding protein
MDGIEEGSTFGPVADFYILGRMAGKMTVSILRDKIKPTLIPSLIQDHPMILINKKSVDRLGITVPENRLKNFRYVGENVISVVFPNNLAPWVIEKSHSGIMVDIVRNALSFQGYSLKPSYQNLKQINTCIPKNVDANAQVESDAVKGYYSRKVAEFETSLISLKSNRVNIRSITELKTKKITAFLNAKRLFGIPFAEAMQANPEYKETGDQEKQVAMLFNRQADLILLDRKIFNYVRQTTHLADTSAPVDFHTVQNLTGPSPVFVVFREKKYREMFDAGFQKLIERGQIEKINHDYIK